MLPENGLMLKNTFAMAKQMKADAVMLHIDPLDKFNYKGRLPKDIKLILLSKKKKLDIPKKKTLSLLSRADGSIVLPKTFLTRISIIKIATMLALSQEKIPQNAKLVFAIGNPDTGLIDMLHYVDTSKESEVITGRGVTKIASALRPEIFQAVLNIATELAEKGREGKPIGTIFVVGHHEQVLQMSRQMIMNPFQGYAEEERNILVASIKDTVREFSALDGAFVISEEGIIIAAGRYLGAAAEETTVPRGLGSRHGAAAGITTLTSSMAFVISESSGDIRIFKDGKIIMHLEKAASKK